MTPTKEDFIKSIFAQGGAVEYISNKQLSNDLKVSGASVTEMNTRLQYEGIINYIPYKGVILTEKGLKLAKQLVRKHRIWEVFLVDTLGFEWDEVHEEADLLEHASSDKVVNRLFEYLGRPTHDPHGKVIPLEDK